MKESPALVVRGDRVVLPDGVRPAAVHVRQGRITAITGGRYYRSFSGAELAEVVTEFLESGRELVGQEEVKESVDLYPKLLMSGAVLLVLSLVI